MSNKKEILDNPFVMALLVLMVFGAMGLALSGLIRKESQPSRSSKKQAHADFNIPDFHVNDCFLVSKKGESLHPHYIKILEKNSEEKVFEVLEVIGNGKNKEVSIRLNRYEEMKSFSNYRESCPKFLVE